VSRQTSFSIISFPIKQTAMSFLRTITMAYLAGLAGFSVPVQAQVAAVTEGDGKRVFMNDNGGAITVRLGVVTGTGVAGPSSYRTRGGKTVTREEMHEHARDAAERHQIDPALVRAIITAESAWNPNAISRKGAQGLMQLMPATANDLGVKDPFDPKQNIEGGVKHLRGLLEKYDGDLDRTLAAYNAGGGTVDRVGGVPNYRETRNYVQKIQDAYFQSGGDRQPRFWRATRTVYQAMDERGKRVFTNE
jgi:hypothetical protein